MYAGCGFAGYTLFGVNTGLRGETLAGDTTFRPFDAGDYESLREEFEKRERIGLLDHCSRTISSLPAAHRLRKRNCDLPHIAIPELLVASPDFDTAGTWGH